jgi:hypothetical protein
MEYGYSRINGRQFAVDCSDSNWSVGAYHHGRSLDVGLLKVIQCQGRQYHWNCVAPENRPRQISDDGGNLIGLLTNLDTTSEWILALK